MVLYKLRREFQKRFLCDIDLKICKSVSFPHPIGIVCYPEKVGKNVKILQGVTIGRRWKISKYPKIGDNVYIGANAILIGDITIGNNVNIGALSVVLKDVPDNTTVTGVWK